MNTIYVYIMNTFTNLHKLLLLLSIFLLAFTITSCDHNNGESNNKDDKEDSHVRRDDRDLNEDPKTLSPPIVKEPLYSCGKTVTVKGFIPYAKIDIFVNGVQWIGGDVSDSPSGQVFKVSPALFDGQVITAKQTFDGTTSEHSNEVTVKDHTDDYPTGIPRPYIGLLPLYDCGKATGVRDVVEGAHLKVYSETAIPGGGFEPAITVGENNSSGSAQSVRINPEFKTGNRISAQYFICEDESPPLKEDSPISLQHIVVDEPAVIPIPTVDEVYDGATTITVRNVLNGAVIDVYSNGVRVGGQATSGGTGQIVRIDPHAEEGESITASQALCTPSGPSPGVTVKPCSELPSAKIKQPEAGDEQVTVTELVNGSRIIIYANGEEIGDGGGSLIQLTRPLVLGEEIIVVQWLGDCRSQWIYVIAVGCNVLTYLPDPDSTPLYPVGSADYGPDNTVDALIDGETLRIWGTVRYPAVADGKGEDIIASPSQLPIVFFVHGYYDVMLNGVEIPNHEGYVYALESLARQGFIAVSINANDLNTGGYHIPTRGKLLLEHINLWVTFSDPGQPDPIFEGKFHNRVDFGNVGIAGHSRGGEAVVHAAIDAGAQNISIKSVLSIAPMDAHGKTLNEIPLLVLLPAADGDVVDNSGARIYDRANAKHSESWFKSQMYIYGANHNQFNSEWIKPDAWFPEAGPDMMTRANQEAMLKSWAVAFFSLTLKGEDNYRAVFEGTAFFEDLENHRVYSSYERTGARELDNYEDTPLNLDKNSLKGQVSIDNGFLTFNEFDLRNDELFSPGASYTTNWDPEDQFTLATSVYNSSFFGDTKGLVVRWEDSKHSFTSKLPNAYQNNSSYDVLSVRIGQVDDPMNSDDRLMNLRIALKDDSGEFFDAQITFVGEIPYPYDHNAGKKSMIHTYRIPISCFTNSSGGAVNSANIKSVKFIFDKTSQGTLAIDNLEFSN